MVIQSENRRGSPESEAADLVERVREKLESAKELPSSAATLQRALVMLDEPLCTNQRLERVLTTDQGAVTGLLRLANSAYFGVPGEVSCAATAIRVVGHRRLRALLCHLIAGKLFEILRLDAPIVDRVRRKALGAAVVCAEVGAPAGDSETLRVAGLLHNVGELALASEFPAELAAATDPVETFGIRYEAAGAVLLRAWRLPREMADAAMHWRTAPCEDERPQTSQRAIDTVHAGGTLAEAWIDGETAVSAAARVQEDVLERLDLPQNRLTPIFESIPRGIHELEAML
jgi:HD-like signal output (HDOD) protein